MPDLSEYIGEKLLDQETPEESVSEGLVLRYGINKDATKFLVIDSAECQACHSAPRVLVRARGGRFPGKFLCSDCWGSESHTVIADSMKDQAPLYTFSVPPSKVDRTRLASNNTEYVAIIREVAKLVGLLPEPFHSSCTLSPGCKIGETPICGCSMPDPSGLLGIAEAIEKLGKPFDDYLATL